MSALPLPSTDLSEYQHPLTGERYAARALARNRDSCAAADQRLLATEQTELCRQLPACQSGLRADGKAVVWVKQPAAA